MDGGILDAAEGTDLVADSVVIAPGGPAVGTPIPRPSWSS